MKIRILPITRDLRNDHQRDMYVKIERKRAEARGSVVIHRTGELVSLLKRQAD